MNEHLCECGCGAPTNPDKRFLQGHHFKKRLTQPPISNEEWSVGNEEPLYPPPPPPRKLTWRDLPHDARKCAKRGGISEDAPVHQMRCVECRMPMWTRDEKREDLCETCEFVLIDRKYRMIKEQNQRRAGQFVNPFTLENPQPIINPLGGPNKLL